MGQGQWQFLVRKFLANGRLRQYSPAIANATVWCTQVKGWGGKGGGVGGRDRGHRVLQGALPRGRQLYLTFPSVGDGSNTVSESTVSNTELSEFFGGSLSFGERTQ